MDTAETELPSNPPASQQEHELRDEPISRNPSAPEDDDKAKDTHSKEPSQSAHSPQISMQQFLDKALEFLSSATNETLGACLVGLGATTYLVLGRVGLVLIGVAGGIILHATWEKPADEAARAAEEKRRKEVGMDVVQRVLKWRDVKNEDKSKEVGEDVSAKVQIYDGCKLDFTGFRPDTRVALEELTDTVICDYVKWWYSPILPTEFSFPEACRHTLTAFLLGISQHMSRKRPADTFLDFLTHSSSTVTVFLNELATATSAVPTASVKDAIRIYLDTKPESSLATIVDRHNQERKLDLVAEDILESYLDHKAYNCEPVRVFLRQMLAKVCIEMTITACSKPEFINGWIVYLLEEGEPEFMKEIDAGVEGAVEEAPKDIKEQSTAVEVATDDAEVERKAQHKRNVSKAQEAMEEAMKEAQRLSQMIAEHDAQRLREIQASDSVAASEEDLKPKAESIASDRNVEPPLAASIASIKTDATESTTQVIYTPTSSQSQSDRDPTDGDRPVSQRSSSEGSKHEVKEEELPTLPSRSFTSFDQLVPQHMPTALSGTPESKKEVAPLTLHNARISIFDDSDPNDRKAIRAKPQNDYMIQIEPASSNYSGWMIFRKYVDFENLHEILGRIAKISGAAVFVEAHAQLPSWKGTTEARLRENLERYLVDAVRFRSLAESEGLKRFLEKDQAMSKSPAAKGGFGWPTPTAFETMGKGMLDALAKAPQEVAGGGKAIIGGVTGVFGGGKQKKPSISSPATGSPIPRRSSIAPTSTPKQSFERSKSNLSLSTSTSRPSEDVVRTPSPIVDTQPARIPQMDSRPPSEPQTPSEPKPKRELSDTAVALGGDQFIQLPPLPSEIPDDYDSNIGLASTKEASLESSEPAFPRASASTFSSTTSLNAPKDASNPNASILSEPPATDSKPKASPTFPLLTEEETRVSVELLFAIISELYTLSGTSAWSLRRTLLNAAKTFLLRPGNPQLLSITSLLQTTVLDGNTSDSGIATHLRKIRENALPTEDELKNWPAELTPEQKEELRVKARKLMVERGMPSALTGVMGAQASREAMSRLFDALQVERVARGLVFGLMLQGLRAVTQ